MENEENVLRSKLSQKANNKSEKMSILEARDKLLRLRREKQTNLATAVAVIGSCPDMCPEYERYFREETNQVTSLEMDTNSNGNAIIDENRMIKEYRRSGADQEEPLPHELRPTHVLNRTMDYLCSNIMDNESVSIGDWYDFVWSRTRSIRKDITQQHLCDLSSVSLTEKCARFHIHCAATLCEENIKDFDPKINEENLSNCLQSLKDFYYDLSLRDIYCENEAEFRSYEILLHLNDAGILRDVKNYRKEIRDSAEVRFAIQSFYCYQSNNYINFFKLSEKANYLTACVMHRYFTHIRRKAFQILRKSYTSNSSSVQEYPIHSLVQYLGFENDEHLIQFCDQIGLECSDNIVYLVRGFNDSNAINSQRSIRLVESKRNCSVGQIINCNELPLNPYKLVPVHDSFDSDGRLNADAYEALDQKMKTNSLNYSSLNTIITSTNSNTKPILVPNVLSKPSFGILSGGITANSNTSLSLLSNTSKTFGSTISTQEPNPFSFAKPFPSFQFPERSFSQISKPNLQFNVCSSDEIKPILVPPQIHTNQVSVTETPLDSNIDIREEIIERFCDNISSELIDSVTKELLVEICGQELEKMRNNIINEMVCKIFSDILLSFTDNMIKEIAFNVIHGEKELKIKEKEAIEKKILIENVSNEINNEIIDSLVDSQIRSISEEVYYESYEELVENEMIANDLFNDSVEIIVEDIASEVLVTATNERELLVERLNHKRLKRLEHKYFINWKNWYLSRKRHKYYEKSFPAAPNWSSTDSQTKTIKYSYSEDVINNSVQELVENDLLANDFFNNSINMFIKNIAEEVLVTTISGSDLLIESLKQKRLKHLEVKYANKWKNYYLKRKQLKNHRKSFPAAPNWTKSDPISSRIKYSYSEIEPNSEILAKRFKSETIQQKQTIKNCLPSTNDIKVLFNEELSQSKALTKRLNEALEPLSNQFLYNSFNANQSNGNNNDNIDIYLEEQEEDDEENDVSIIDLFETSTDKMNRLKRMLAEEQNYVSLNNFVSYLTKNKDTNQEIEDQSNYE